MNNNKKEKCVLYRFEILLQQHTISYKQNDLFSSYQLACFLYYQFHWC